MTKSLGGMVVCPHYLASQAGADVLRQGGTAVDATIAVQAALAVVYPHMTGLGGDAFWLVYEAATSTLQGLNGSGPTAHQATVAAYQQRGLTAIPQRGPLAAITVPGAVESWGRAHQRWGVLPWGELLQPAIALAQTGYPVSGSQAHWTRQDLTHFQIHSPQGCPYLPQGQVPRAGDMLRNPDLGHTLTHLAQAGAGALYQGALGTAIADHLADLGGLLTAADLAQYQSSWVTPIATTYRGHRVYTLPPNSQGFTLLQALNIVEGVDLAALGHGTAAYYHLMVEALKLAMADRDRWLTDPAWTAIPLEELIAKDYGDRQRQRIDWHRAATYQPGAVGGDTVYTAVVDGAGNGVSVIQSLYFDFGSTVVVPQTGIVLQNRGSFFTLEPHPVNTLAPGKLPFHTLMPSLVMAGDRPRYILGTMGGEGQPQTQLALLTRMIDFAMDPQGAIAAPRWLWGRTWGESTVGLTLEGRIPAPVQSALAALGHGVRSAPDWTATMGHAHAIALDPDTGELTAGCDPRSDGAAIAP